MFEQNNINGLDVFPSVALFTCVIIFKISKSKSNYDIRCNFYYLKSPILMLHYIGAHVQYINRYMILFWCKFVKMYKKLKEYYNYVIAVSFKIWQWEVLKRDCEVYMILAVFVIKFKFQNISYREMQPINWAIKIH